MRLDEIAQARRVSGREEHADAVDAPGLLRACAERPRRRRAAEKRDEFAPSHVSRTLRSNLPQSKLRRPSARKAVPAPDPGTGLSGCLIRRRRSSS
jgi:hypothetical protein